MYELAFRIKRAGLLLAVLGWLFVGGAVASAQPVTNRYGSGEIRIVELQGKVEVATSAAPGWVVAQTNLVLNPFGRLRTGPNSRVALRWSDQSVVLFNALTELEILPPDAPGADRGLHLVRGLLSFFHRDQPGRIRVITRGAVAGVEGTEFALAVDDADRSTLSVADGRVRFGNEKGSLLVTNHQQAAIELGKAPVYTAGFVVNDVLQWCFYYPAVLDLAELPLTDGDQKALAGSLEAYRAGDLLSALAKHPGLQSSDSDAARVYYAALLLAVGQVEQTEAILAALPSRNAGDRLPRLTTALRLVIAAVKRQPNPATAPPELATEFLAGSYHEQSRVFHGGSLEKALALARQAQARSPQFGFAGARVAELEFSFGRACAAEEALESSLKVSPRNAQALALNGFLKAAQNHPRAALDWFNQALTVDNALGNAWLGRGLCRIRCGDDGGREDLLVAAAIEPQRASLRSYLGKAYASAKDQPHAEKELALAKDLAPGDPTPWFYSSLLDWDQNRVNDAITDLEKSQSLNDNRRVFRSQQLLDQDRAVRGANLAAMYREAGMAQVSLNEAGRAVNRDYANSSAHLFLANSFIGLQDPSHANTRFDTPANNEYLLANLLSPVGADIVTTTTSQEEYSRLFERNGFGVFSSTEYLSRGTWKQAGVQFGNFGTFSYNFEALYNSYPGQRENNDLEERSLTLTMKQQVTPQDSLFLYVQQYENEAGYQAQNYPNVGLPQFRSTENQTPILGLGYHHEWNPGVHTLAYVTRLDDQFSFVTPSAPTAIAFYPDLTPGTPTLTGVNGLTMREFFGTHTEIYSGEIQQIWEQPKHTTLVGLRAQSGYFHTTNYLDFPSRMGAIFPDPPDPISVQDVNVSFQRVNFYGYHQWQVFEPLRLIGGLSYDRMTYPENVAGASLSDRSHDKEQFSPKAGFIWTPAEDTTVRFAYARSLGGVTFEQSFQLEPSQVAGFIQSHRSIIPESAVGWTSGADNEIFGLSLEQRFHTRTYVTLSGELLATTVDRAAGIFNYYPDELDYPIPATTHERLQYQERSVQLTLNQLLGRSWALGARYRLSEAVLHDTFVDMPANLLVGYNGFIPKQRNAALLQELGLSAIYNHPRGFFMKGEAEWLSQSNQGYGGAPADDSWLLNAYVGYRFPRRKAEISVGVLNLLGQDYHLMPITFHDEPVHDRNLIVQFKFSF